MTDLVSHSVKRDEAISDVLFVVIIRRLVLIEELASATLTSVIEVA